MKKIMFLVLLSLLLTCKKDKDNTNSGSNNPTPTSYSVLLYSEVSNLDFNNITNAVYYFGINKSFNTAPLLNGTWSWTTTANKGDTVNMGFGLTIHTYPPKPYNIKNSISVNNQMVLSETNTTNLQYIIK